MSDHIVYAPKWTIDLPEGVDYITIRPIGDLHFGNPYLNEQLLEEVLTDLADPFTYWLGVGDYFELATKKHKHGGVFEATMNPQDQVEQFVNVFGEFADRCLGLINGNHDDNLVKEFGLNPVRMAGIAMNISTRVFPDAMCIPVTLLGKNGPVDYSIYATHGTGVANTSGGKVAGLDDLGSTIVADIIVGAHTHMDTAFRDRIFVPQLVDYYKHIEGEPVAYVDRTYVNTGSFLDYGGYAAKGRMKARPPGCPSIIVDGNRKSVRVLV